MGRESHRIWDPEVVFHEVMGAAYWEYQEEMSKRGGKPFFG